MPDATYRSLARSARHEGDKVRGSRFPAVAAPIRTADEALGLVATMRAEFPQANHHAYAYRLRGPDRFRYSDDGEPSGSAGRPILQRLDGLGLSDVVVVVSRVFGGTKLGVGGLVRAYGGAAADVLARAEIREIVPQRRLRLTFPYELSGEVDSVLAAAGVSPCEASYGEAVVFDVEIPDGDAETFQRQLLERTAGRVRIDPSGD